MFPQWLKIRQFLPATFRQAPVPCLKIPLDDLQMISRRLSAVIAPLADHRREELNPHEVEALTWNHLAHVVRAGAVHVDQKHHADIALYADKLDMAAAVMRETPEPATIISFPVDLLKYLRNNIKPLFLVGQGYEPAYPVRPATVTTPNVIDFFTKTAIPVAPADPAADEAVAFNARLSYETVRFGNILFEMLSVKLDDNPPRRRHVGMPGLERRQ